MKTHIKLITSLFFVMMINSCKGTGCQGNNFNQGINKFNQNLPSREQVLRDQEKRLRKQRGY